MHAAAARRSVDVATEQLGGLDILVNNAGIFLPGALRDMELGDIDALLNTNVRSVVLATQAAIPHLPRGGRIITIGSCLAERVPFGGSTLYAMTKSALLAFNRGLSRELGPLAIAVNLVQPGPTDTDMNPADGEHAELMRGLTSVGRHGTPDDVAAAVAFLASEHAAQINGSVITVDGGANA